MLQYLVELFNVLIPWAGGLLVALYPVWKSRDVSIRAIAVVLSAYALFICVSLLIIRRFLVIDIAAIQNFKLVMAVIAPAVQFFIFRGRKWQNIFLYSVAVTITTIWTGTGMYAGENLSSSNLLFTANIVTLSMIVITLPPLLFMLRRLCANPDMKQAVTFWRLAWLVPAAFFVMILVTSTYFGGGEFSDGFIFIRVFVYVVLLGICYLFEVAVRQISEAEAAKRKAAENAAKADFYRRMAHELLTPLTKVSTNIQVANAKPEKAAELLPRSQKEIMLMAEKINTALDESENGGASP